MGSCRSIDCDKITKSVWDWAIKRLCLSSAHIPGRLNIAANEESRKTESRTEWKLNRNISYRKITKYHMLEYFQYNPKIDLFASRLNTQLLRFFLYRPDPFAEVTNAFSVSWKNKKFYCFLPFACIGNIIEKFSADKATGLLVVPN